MYCHHAIGALVTQIPLNIYVRKILNLELETKRLDQNNPRYINNEGKSFFSYFIGRTTLCFQQFELHSKMSSAEPYLKCCKICESPLSFDCLKNFGVGGCGLQDTV